MTRVLIIFLLLLICAACSRTPCDLYTSNLSYKNLTYSDRSVDELVACVKQHISNPNMRIMGLSPNVKPILDGKTHIGYMLKHLGSTIYVVRINRSFDATSQIETFYSRLPLTSQNIKELNKHIEWCSG